jgi:hypothetical protein
VQKVKEERKYGEYRTRRLVLEAWDRLEAGGWKLEAGAAGRGDGGSDLNAANRH